MDALDTEVTILLGSAARLQTIAAQLKLERDAAIEQRNTILTLVNRQSMRKKR